MIHDYWMQRPDGGFVRQFLPGISQVLDWFDRHCARYRLISPRKYPRGVFRFRSLEEAQDARADKAI